LLFIADLDEAKSASWGCIAFFLNDADSAFELLMVQKY